MADINNSGANQNEVELDEILNEEMYCLVAPDGTAQISTLSPDLDICVGWINYLASKGTGRPLVELINMGFSILPVRVTILQNGTAEQGFQSAVMSLS